LNTHQREQSVASSGSAGAGGRALARLGKSVRKAIDETGKAGDADTSDLFTGISRNADKSLWLLEAHLQADR
jgi:starvation-inducible DNA-binding protein